MGSFSEEWQKVGDELVEFSAASLEGIALDSVSYWFLREMGLPKDAAPFLRFGPPKSGSLPTPAELWGLPDPFRTYRVVGSNGSGDPVCVDESDSSVVYLNHDASFQPVFMNLDVSKLGQCLLEYRRLILDTNALRGSDAWLNGDIPINAIDFLEQAIRGVDLPALKEDTFWAEEIFSLGQDAAEFEASGRE